MRKEPELAYRIGKRLRDLRLETGLTQAQVAERMGTEGMYGKQFICQLESGKRSCPTVRTISLYLRACGARWSRLSDVLDYVAPSGTDIRPIQDSGLAQKTKRRLARLTERQVDKYRRRMAYPVGRPAVPPRQQDDMVRRLGRYRVVANVIEQMVDEYLRSKPVPHGDYVKYKVIARQMLGKLWRGPAAGSRQRATTKSSGRRRLKAELSGQELDSKLVRQVQKLVARRFRAIVKD